MKDESSNVKIKTGKKIQHLSTHCETSSRRGFYVHIVKLRDQAVSVQCHTIPLTLGLYLSLSFVNPEPSLFDSLVLLQTEGAGKTGMT